MMCWPSGKNATEWTESICLVNRSASVMYVPARDQRQYVKSRRLSARAEDTENDKEDTVNKCRMYARVGSVRCEPLSDDEVQALL